MGSIIEIGGAMISDAGRRLEVNGGNIANATTPGYKAVISFSSHLGVSGLPPESGERIAFLSQLTPGAVTRTDNVLDLTITGDGFFAVEGESGLFYTRAGQFHTDAEGRVVDHSGRALQAGGGDIVLRSEDVRILADGTVLDAGEPVARIAIFRILDPARLIRSGTAFTTASDNTERVAAPSLQQGMLEASNVSLAHEMLSMMQVQRSAETGRHLVQVYDDLLGRVLTTFGQA